MSFQSFQFGVLMEAVPTLPRETILMSTFIRLLCTEIPLGLSLQFVHSKRQIFLISSNNFRGFSRINLFISRQGNNKIVLCETSKYNKKPTQTNHRFEAFWKGGFKNMLSLKGETANKWWTNPASLDPGSPYPRSLPSLTPTTTRMAGLRRASQDPKALIFVVLVQIR